MSDQNWMEIIGGLETEKAKLREQVEKLKAELESIDGALNDPRANLTLTTSEIIWELKGQVEQMTKERDAAWSVNPTVSENLLREQLAAFAEQNEKMRNVMRAIAEAVDYYYTEKSADRYCFHEAISLPNLASPVLNRIRAEGMREAEKIVRKRVQWVSNGQGIQYRSTAPESISAESLADEIRARADELEKTNG